MAIEAKIWRAVEWAKRRGLRVIDCFWAVTQVRDGDEVLFRWEPEDGDVCPLGAVLVEHTHPTTPGRLDPVADSVVWVVDPTPAAASLLGVTEKWVHAFISGVDGELTSMFNHPSPRSAYRMGRRIRKRLGLSG